MNDSAKIPGDPPWLLVIFVIAAIAIGLGMTVYFLVVLLIELLPGMRS